jgi:hypothetical protein
MRRAFALAFALAAPAWGDASPPPPARRPPATVCLTLRSEAARYGEKQPVELAASAAVRNGPVPPARHSFVEIRNARGELVFRTPDRAFFASNEPLELALGFSTNAGPAIPALAPGDYRARWLLDAAVSNETRFSVGPGAPPPLSLEVEDQGCAPGPALMMHLYNPGPELVDLPGSWGGSVVLVDGARYSRRWLSWNGGSGLPAGQSWGTDLSLGEYGAPLAPGRHEVRLEMAGRRSNTVVVTIPATSGARKR